MKLEYFGYEVEHDLYAALHNHFPNAKIEVDLVIVADIDKIIEVVSSLMGLNREGVIGEGRDGVRKVAARQIICWVACRLCGHTHKRIAKAINRGRYSITNSVKQADDLIYVKDQLIVENIKTVMRKLLYEN